MSSSISVSPQVYDLLVKQAREAQQTPDALAEELLRRSLITEKQWQADFEALINRVQAHSSTFTSEEIEADITAAAQEAKELRRARRRAN